MKSSKKCIACKHYGVCTISKGGRTISRLFNEELKIELEEKYASKEGQRIYKMRREKAELPFGYIKRDMGAGHFLLRGSDGVNGEMALLATGFNIKRMINLLGIPVILSVLGGA